MRSRPSRRQQDHEKAPSTESLPARISSCRAVLLSAHRRVSAALFNRQDPAVGPRLRARRHGSLIIVPLSARECAQAVGFKVLEKCELLRDLSKDVWRQQEFVVEVFRGVENRLAVRVQCEFVNEPPEAENGNDVFVPRRHILVAQRYVADSRKEKFEPLYTLYLDDTGGHASRIDKPSFLRAWCGRFWELMTHRKFV